MDKEYQLSEDGTIFKIEDDGSISKIGKIEEGRLIDLTDNGKKSSGDRLDLTGIVFLVLITLTIVLSVLLSQAKQDYRNALYESMTLYDSLTLVKRERDHAMDEFASFKSNLWQKKIPIIITEVQMGNHDAGGRTETDFGNFIYTSNTMYLTPKISYVGLSAGNRILDVKIFSPDGSLITGNNSPKGYSFSRRIYCTIGKGSSILNGWGNSKKGHWKEGTYRIEFWHNEICIYSDQFIIYR